MRRAEVSQENEKSWRVSPGGRELERRAVSERFSLGFDAVLRGVERGDKAP